MKVNDFFKIVLSILDLEYPLSPQLSDILYYEIYF